MLKGSADYTRKGEGLVSTASGGGGARSCVIGRTTLRSFTPMGTSIAIKVTHINGFLRKRR